LAKRGVLLGDRDPERIDLVLEQGILYLQRAHRVTELEHGFADPLECDRLHCLTRRNAHRRDGHGKPREQAREDWARMVARARFGTHGVISAGDARIRCGNGPTGVQLGSMKNTRPIGSTLIELLVSLAVVAALMLVGVPGTAALRNRSAVRASITELVSALALARSTALAESRVVAISLDTVAGRALVLAPPDTLLDLPLGARYGVTLSATRDSIAYGPTGRGYGAANATITIRRRNAADTVIVSRLGRVKS
jgi:type IV fimbrial biogenesis protein FimT